MYAERWIAKREMDELRSARFDRSTLRKRILPFLGKKRLDRIDTQCLEGLVRDLKKAEYSPRSIRKADNIVRQILRSAKKEGLIITVPEAPDNRPRDIPVDPIKQELKAMTTFWVRKFLDANFVPLRYALWATLLLSGQRIDEVLALPWRALQLDVDKPFGRMVVAVSQDQRNPKILHPTKTFMSSGVPIHPRLHDILLKWRDIAESTGSQDRVFSDDGRPIAYKRALRWFKWDTAKIGVKDHTPHDCRHTFETLITSAEEIGKPDMVRRITHAPAGGIGNRRYSHYSFEAIAKELAKWNI